MLSYDIKSQFKKYNYDIKMQIKTCSEGLLHINEHVHVLETAK